MSLLCLEFFNGFPPTDSAALQALKIQELGLSYLLLLTQSPAGAFCLMGTKTLTWLWAIFSASSLRQCSPVSVTLLSAQICELVSLGCLGMMHLLPCWLAPTCIPATLRGWLRSAAWASLGAGWDLGSTLDLVNQILRFKSPGGPCTFLSLRSSAFGLSLCQSFTRTFPNWPIHIRPPDGFTHSICDTRRKWDKGRMAGQVKPANQKLLTLELYTKPNFQRFRITQRSMWNWWIVSFE